MSSSSSSASPKHAAIRDELRALVQRLAVGQPLPPERQLAERWGVARMTVRQAIAALAQEGLVRSVHGKGNLRAPDPIPLRVRLGSFADAVREQEMEPSTRVLECAVDPDPPPVVRGFLTSGALLRIRRLRLGNDVPLALERTWLPESLVPDRSDEVLSGSLYALLEAQATLPDTGEESVRADLPDAAEARLLDLPRTRPVLRLVRRALAEGTPVEYAEAVLPADRHELWFPLARHDADSDPRAG